MKVLSDVLVTGQGVHGNGCGWFMAWICPSRTIYFYLFVSEMFKHISIAFVIL